MKWSAAVLALLLTACWQGKPMGKEWSKETLMAFAVDTIKTKTPSTEIPCRSTAHNGLQACFAVNGPVGSVRTPLDEAFGEELHQLDDWRFVGDGGAVAYETRGGDALELGLVYGANDGYTVIIEKLPKGAQGVLHVFVEPPSIR
ncbi:hypothetical protein [Deinococcus knuensis]|uniref:Uncharacterized protein n=1 Tax=Deinococcus knuensis TaxID=1837380 RepID=A0ABQ2SY93_9DEIO|nr:hypothetical protein [Deinococcus knuensis]GGS43547.1 hypothetical protein GCM10008961_38210 [Deinococcus knuensis]